MEIAGLAVGVAGLVGLFSVCRDAIEHIDTYQSFGLESRSIKVRFELSKQIFRRWADDVRITDIEMSESHHPYLDNPEIASVVRETLVSIGEIFHVTVNSSLALRLGLTDNNLLSSTSDLGVLSKKSRHHKSLQVSSKRDKIAWMLGGKNNFVKQVDAFGDLVEKLCTLVPTQHVDSRLSELEKSKNREERFEYMDLIPTLKDISHQNKAENQEKVRTWLGAVNTQETYDKLCQTRLSGTCDWIFDSPEYIEWASSDSPPEKAKLLWINAPAGFGKSFLCAKIVESITRTSTSPIAYFFCSSDVETQREPVAIVRSWILQLIGVSQEAFAIVQQKVCSKEILSASSFLLWELFKSIIRVVPNSTLAIDGLDECTQTDTHWKAAKENVRQDFLEELKVSIENTTTRVLVVSRDEVDIRSGVYFDIGNDATQAVCECRLSRNDVEPDLALFSRNIVDQRLPNKGDALRQEFAIQMAEKSNGMFLWVKLQAKHLRKGQNRKQIHEAIEDMPSGLEHVYDRDWMKVAQLKRGDKPRALAILRWVMFALRPLTVAELTEALIVTRHGYDCDDLQLDDWPDQIDQDYIDDQIMGLCGSMLELKSTSLNQPLDCKTVHLVHFSVKEFLLRVLPDTDGSDIDSVAFSDPISQNNYLAKICLGYLGYAKSWQCSNSSSCDQKCRPFLDYAVKSWDLHVSLGNEMDEGLSSSINKFFHPQNQNWHMWRTHFERNPQTTTETKEGRNPATPLYYASFFGFISAVKFLDEHGNVELNAIGGFYGSALQAASYRGHLQVVRFLCSRGADVNIRGGEYETAINAAACMGHALIVQHLLGLGADISVTDSSKRTPIYWASREGHLDVVKLLFENGADITCANTYGWTPLNVAADGGHLEVVKYLITKGGANLTVASAQGWTPLNNAASEGHLEVVKVLIENGGADITVTNANGWTPLNTAADGGHLEVVKYLIEKAGADISVASAQGWTPLNSAADNDHFEVVKFLIEKGADITVVSDGWNVLSLAVFKGDLEVVTLLLEKNVDVGFKNKHHETPLSLASRYGHEAIAKLLLEKNVDMESKDMFQQTPLTNTARNGHATITKLLLEKGADLESKDLNNQTPLSIASMSGHEAIVDLLFEKGADPDAIDALNRTPLSWAAANGHEVIVKFLLEKGVDLEREDFKRQTPLSLASKSGREATVKLLFEKGADPEAIDGLNSTPLSWAIENGHEAIVKFFLEKGVDLKRAGSKRQTPLSLASKSGREAIVKLLFERGADLDAADDDGGTPLSWAAENGHEAIVKFLLEKGADANVRDRLRYTPLSLASGNGHEAIVKLLFERGADLDCGTPLSWAAENGHEAIVKFLLERGADANIGYRQRYTPLSLASGNGHEAIVKLLFERGADLDCGTPLSWAAENGHEAIVKFLLERGADANIGYCQRQTPLLLASGNGHEAVVKLLLENHADVDAKDHIGYTSLSTASAYGHTAIVKLLLERGADPNVVGVNGETPLSLASRLDYPALVNLLLKNGADPKAIDAPSSSTT